MYKRGGAITIMTHHHNHHRTPQLYEDAKQYIASYLGVQCKPYDECLHTKKVLSIPLINMLSVPKEKQAIAKKFYNASIESEDRGDHRLGKSKTYRTVFIVR